MRYFMFAVLAISLSVTTLHSESCDIDFADQEATHIVGSVQGACCQPGRRYGCGTSNPLFPAHLSQCVLFQNDVCPAPAYQPCTSAQCAPAATNKYCDYTPLLVGRNECKWTRVFCGTALIWNGFGWEVVNKYRCDVSEKTNWASDPAPVFASVCLTGASYSACTATYSHCDQ